jgi:hypothetical protein
MWLLHFHASEDASTVLFVLTLIFLVVGIVYFVHHARLRG